MIMAEMGNGLKIVISQVILYALYCNHTFSISREIYTNILMKKTFSEAIQDCYPEI